MSKTWSRKTLDDFADFARRRKVKESLPDEEAFEAVDPDEVLEIVGPGDLLPTQIIGTHANGANVRRFRSTLPATFVANYRVDPLEGLHELMPWGPPSTSLSARGDVVITPDLAPSAEGTLTQFMHTAPMPSLDTDTEFARNTEHDQNLEQSRTLARRFSLDGLGLELINPS